MSAVDPASSYACWLPVPRPESVADADAWARRAAADSVRQRGFDAAVEAPLARYLAALVREPVSAYADVRFLFLLEPDLGATLWELTYAEPDPEVDAAVLVGVDAEAPLGSDVVEFEHDGHAGLSCVRYLVADAGPGDPAGERTVEAVALMTATRPLRRRPVCLVARAQTALLESLSLSLTPMQHLLTSDLLAELVEDPPTDPADRPA